MYLYHFPIYLWLTPDRTGLPTWPLLGVRLAVTLALALLSYRLVEWPIRSGARVRGRQPWLLPPAAAGVVALAFIGVTAQAPPDPSLAWAQGHADLTAWESGRRPIRIMMVGDSVADVIARGLERWSRDDERIGVGRFTQVGCGMARGGRVNARDAQERAAACDGWAAGLRIAIDRFRPTVVVVYSGGWDLLDRELPGWGGARRIGDPEYDRWLRSEYVAAIDVLSSRGARVVWLSSLCVGRRTIGPSAIFQSDRIRLLNESIIRPLAEDDAARVSFLDLHAVVCPGGEFRDDLDGVQHARPDGVHFSEAGADWVARWLGPQLLRGAGVEAPAEIP